MLPNQAMATVKLGDFGISKNCEYACMYLYVHVYARMQCVIGRDMLIHTHACIHSHINTYATYAVNARDETASTVIGTYIHT